MARVRKTHSPEFKAKVALEAIKGIDTLSSIAARYGVNPIIVGRWKQEALSNLEASFRKRPERNDGDWEKKFQASLMTIGRLKVENDFLVEASRKLGITGGKK